MHTRKRATHGGHTASGHKHAVPAEWQLVLWLGIVALALGLVVLAPEIKDDFDAVVPTQWTGSQGPNTGQDRAVSRAQAAPLGAGAVTDSADLQVESGANAPSSPAYTAH